MYKTTLKTYSLFRYLIIAQQELQKKREQEVAVLKRSIEEETVSHEATLAEQRHKHSQELQQLNEQHEQIKKAKSGMFNKFLFEVMILPQ